MTRASCVTAAAEVARDASPNEPDPTPTSRSPSPTAAASTSRSTSAPSSRSARRCRSRSPSATRPWPIYPRSSNKPMQAVAMVRAGLRLRAASCSPWCAPATTARRAHLAAARRDPRRRRPGRGGRSRNTPDLPLEPSTRRTRSCAPAAAATAAADELQRQAQRHAGDVRAQRLADDARYLDPEHPLQRRSPTTIAELTGEPRRRTSASTGAARRRTSMSLLGLARGFRAIAGGAAGAAGDAVHRAMTEHPEHGRRRAARRHPAHAARAGPDRQGRRRGRVRRGAARRPRGRAEDRRRREPGAAAGDGRRPASGSASTRRPSAPLVPSTCSATADAVGGVRSRSAAL